MIMYFANLCLEIDDPKDIVDHFWELFEKSYECMLYCEK